MTTVAIVGLGYVGLPLAIAFGKRFKTLGYDLSAEKLSNYRRKTDPTGEVTTEEFTAAQHLAFVDNPGSLAGADFIIIAVPTPVNEAHQPDFTALTGASRTVGSHMRRGAIVVYESTVYPGATEEICVPILEAESGSRWMTDFHVGYSPERINPGDKEHTLERIVKVVSGDDAETLERVAALYGAVVTAGIHRASSIKVAEAAKVIENTQRDLNIALINELSIIFNLVGIDTQDVLAAAGTKWNFIPFKPGLVGGHCIGVDPYYLTYKAETLGYHPQVVLAGRRINDGMGRHIAAQTIKEMIQAGRVLKGARVNVLGLTFKEDCPDLRNSRVIDVIRELQSFGLEIAVCDPVASPKEAREEYRIDLVDCDDLEPADAVVAAVAHRPFRQFSVERWNSLVSPQGVIVDVKAIVPACEMRSRGIRLWRL